MDLRNSSNLLSELNLVSTYKHIPIAVYLGLIGVIGLIGNSVVCYIYGTVYTQSNSRIFLICMATIDLGTCIVDIPLEIVNVLNQYEFNKPLLCKFSRTGNALTTFYSSGILLSIATDRYLKICRPHGFQISNTTGKRLCLSLFFATVGITWPMFVMYGVKSTHFVYASVNLTRTECSVDDQYKNTMYPVIYNVVMLLLFVAALVMLIVFYSMIGRKVRFFAFKNERRGSHSDALETDDDIDTVRVNRAHGSINNVHNQKVPMIKNLTEVDKIRPSKNNQEMSSAVESQSHVASDSSNGTLKKTSHFIQHASDTQLDQIRRKRKLARNTTYLMFIVTISFIIASLPFLILVILDNTVKNFVDDMDLNKKVVYRFFLRSYFLSAAVNPIIYSIFDRRFRHACRGVAKKWNEQICHKSGHNISS